MDEAMTRLGQEYAAQGKTSTFETLKPFLDPFDSKVSLSYEQVAKGLHVSVGSVKALIHRLRKRYTCLLREEVARTVSDPRESRRGNPCSLRGPDRNRRTVRSVNMDDRRTCLVCGTQFPGSSRISVGEFLWFR